MHKVDLAYIIDDDDITIHLTDRLLRKVEFCHWVETFTDARKALERLKFSLKAGGNIPNMILFDLNMPHMDGWEFMDELVKLPNASKVPVFVFTSSVNPADKERSYKYGIIRDFISKPLTVQKLNKILRIIDK